VISSRGLENEAASTV